LNDYLSSLNSLYGWIKSNGYYSWDPYDALNSKKIYGLIKTSIFLQSLFIQLNVYNPVNLRTIFNVEKTIDLKGISILNQGYCNLYKSLNKELLIEDIKSCNLIINNNDLKYENYDSWASHSFKYIKFGKFELVSSRPDIIGVTETIISLIKSYEILKKEECKQTALSAGNFLINYLYIVDENGSHFKYNLASSDKLVINVSAKAVEALSYILYLNKDERIIDICNRTVDFLIDFQNEDGSWDYSIDGKGQVDRQHDFHQGFILDGLISFLPYYSDKGLLIKTIKKGADYYKKLIFDEDGKCYYRYPLKYPIDIHNQAQGIITFHNLNSINLNYDSFQYKIADWTIENMQDKSGYFYHQKWPIITNKIPYLRWSQAWMFKALSLIARAR
jgi:hypothetical protein